MAPILNVLISSGSKKKEPKCVCLSEYVFIGVYRYFLRLKPVFGLYRQILMKVPNIKSHEIPSIGSRIETCGQTDGHDETNKRLSRL